MNILDRILASKRIEVEARKVSRPLAEVKEAVSAADAPRDFAAALVREDRPHRVIAEVKKASPSKGLIREDFDPVTIARAYSEGGAAAISVLTDEEFFQGRLEYLEAIRREVDVPLLRKDFMIDVYQVHESRAAGADAVLLIVAALDDETLELLAREAEDLGMASLWEVHDLEEADRARRFSPRIVGVNNRDLKTFDVSLDTTRNAIPQLPEDTVIVSESGFSERHEIEMMVEWGVDAFLIGESLMRAADPCEALRGLVDVDRN